MKIIESSLIAALLLVNIATPATSHATRQPSTAQRGRAVGKSFARPVHAGKPVRNNFLSSTVKANAAVKPLEVAASKRTAVQRTSTSRPAFKVVLNRLSGVAQMLVGAFLGGLAGGSIETALQLNEPFLVGFAIIASLVGFKFAVGGIEIIDAEIKESVQRRANAK